VTDQPTALSFPTSLRTSAAAAIGLLGKDLAAGLMGSVSFGELAYWSSRCRAIGRDEGVSGPHLRLFEAIGGVNGEILGRTLLLNGAGVCGAARADLGLPVELRRGVALLARCAGLLGRLAEELRSPIANSIYLAVGRNAVYVPPAGQS
jgi:hypothetical protein